jgi:hypothetical protein
MNVLISIFLFFFRPRPQTIIISGTLGPLDEEIKNLSDKKTENNPKKLFFIYIPYIIKFI